MMSIKHRIRLWLGIEDRHQTLIDRLDHEVDNLNVDIERLRLAPNLAMNIEARLRASENSCRALEARLKQIEAVSTGNCGITLGEMAMASAADLLTLDIERQKNSAAEAPQFGRVAQNK